MTYEPLEQLVYLIELTLISTGFFVAGFLLLGSKREKDKQYQWWGWVFYLIGFLAIATMCMVAF